LSGCALFWWFGDGHPELTLILDCNTKMRLVVKLKFIRLSIGIEYV